MSYQFDRNGFVRIKDCSAKVEPGEMYPEKSGLVCLLEKGAKLPKRAHDTDAGADLFPLSGGVISPGTQKMVDTGVALKIPVGYAGFIHMRSSQRKNKLTGWGTGIIDSDYRGTLRVIIANNGDTDYVYDQETAIAQLVIQRVELVDFVDIWNDTDRGTGGFGSTGR